MSDRAADIAVTIGAIGVTALRGSCTGAHENASIVFGTGAGAGTGTGADTGTGEATTDTGADRGDEC